MITGLGLLFFYVQASIAALLMNLISSSVDQFLSNLIVFIVNFSFLIVSIGKWLATCANGCLGFLLGFLMNFTRILFIINFFNDYIPMIPFAFFEYMLLGYFYEG